jgi:N-acetylneuraminic acid mutarotase
VLKNEDSKKAKTMKRKLKFMKDKTTNPKSTIARIKWPLALAACLTVLGLIVSITLASDFNLPDRSANLSLRSAGRSTAATLVLPPTTLTLAERVAYQRAIEEVYWRHRIWPEERPDPKPSLNAVISPAQLETKVEDYLRDSQALEDHWQRPITAEQLQAEMDRMAQHTKQPDVLRELFEALGNDPFVIAECLARQVLAERFANGDPVAAGVPPAHPTRMPPQKPTLAGWLAKAETQVPVTMAAASANYALPTISDAPNGCVDDTWTATSTTNAPTAREGHTAVWTGTEMIVWGGVDQAGFFLNTGGRYDPSTDTWTVTNTTNAPSARAFHKAVWTGSEMIVWGGDASSGFLNTGGRYNPSTDSWTATSTGNAPEARFNHTAVSTNSQMIVWGGRNGDSLGTGLNTGGRYNPTTDSWTATSTTNAPFRREAHTGIWTGNEMIVWGGRDQLFHILNTGGRYNPSTDSWTSTSTTNAPTARTGHTAVWTDSEMIVWGGTDFLNKLNTGGRYNPSSDSWIATSTTNAPTGRYSHTAIWSDNEMIVWGGAGDSGNLNTGERYCAQSGVPTITLSAAGRKVGGINTVRLTWSGATSTNIDVYRNDMLIVTTANDGSYTDSTGDTGRARYTYRVCEAGTSTCSNEVTVTFRQ